MLALLRHFTGPAFWFGWIAAVVAAVAVLWSAGPRWWSLAIAGSALVGPLVLLLVVALLTRD
jgi:hypothetical protein